MNPLDNKAITQIAPATVATNATAAMIFSKLGTRGETFDHANILVNLGTAATNSVTITTLKLQEGDTSVISNHTDIVAFTGGTATSTSVGFVLPVAAADQDGGQVIEFSVDLSKRKKYISLELTPGQSMVCGATAILSKSGQSIDNTTTGSLTNLSDSDTLSTYTIVKG